AERRPLPGPAGDLQALGRSAGEAPARALRRAELRRLDPEPEEVLERFREGAPDGTIPCGLMFNFVCGALGLVGGFIFGLFLFSEAEFGYQEGRKANVALPHVLYGCVLIVSGPMIAIALIPWVGFRWCLLGPVAEIFFLVSARGVGRLLGSRRSVA